MINRVYTVGLLLLLLGFTEFTGGPQGQVHGGQIIGLNIVSAFASPARIHAILNRNGNGISPLYDDRELAAIASRYDRLIGLDGHGYSIDSSPAPTVRALGYNGPMACLLSATMIEQPRGPRYTQIDDTEDALLHSADPASAAIVRTIDGRLKLHFRQDFRSLPHFSPVSDLGAPSGPYLRKPIVAYQVRGAWSADGPFDDVVARLDIREPDNSAFHYRLLLPEDPLTNPRDRWFRVFSEYESGAVVEYSEPLSYSAGGNLGNLDSGDASGFAETWISQAQRQQFTWSALCAPGYSCPSASEIGVVVDTNGDNFYDDSARCTSTNAQQIVASECETLPFEVATTTSEGTLYELTVDSTTSLPAFHTSYRIVDLRDGTVLAPFVPNPFAGPAEIAGAFGANSPAGSWEIGANNRITSEVWSGVLVDQQSSFWVDSVLARAEQCEALGYDGIFLDFAWDRIDGNWMRISSLPPDYQADAYTKAGMDLLTALSSQFPQLWIGFNGANNDVNLINTRLRLENSEVVHLEFFFADGGGVHDRDKIRQDVERALKTSLLGKVALLTVGIPPTIATTEDCPSLDPLIFENCIASADSALENHAVRMGSFALYLLASNPSISYYAESETFGPYQMLIAFPEWSIPLGAPLSEVRSLDDLQLPGLPDGIWGRNFENGLVLVNVSEVPIVVDLAALAYRAVPRGALDSEVAREGLHPLASTLYDGYLEYEAVQSVTVEPLQGEVLITAPPVSSATLQ